MFLIFNQNILHKLLVNSLVNRRLKYNSVNTYNFLSIKIKIDNVISTTKLRGLTRFK